MANLIMLHNTDYTFIRCRIGKGPRRGTIHTLADRSGGARSQRDAIAPVCAPRAGKTPQTAGARPAPISRFPGKVIRAGSWDGVSPGTRGHRPQRGSRWPLASPFSGIAMTRAPLISVIVSSARDSYLLPFPNNPRA